MGADSSRDHGAASAQYRAGEAAHVAGPSNAPAWMSDQVYLTVMPKFIADANHAGLLKDGVHYDGDVAKLRMPRNGDDARAQYQAFDKDGKRVFDQYAAINTAADPQVGGAYVMNTEANMPGFMESEAGSWTYHWAGVIMKDGANNVALESYAVGQSANRTADQQYHWVNRNWRFQMYGTAIEGQSFHEQHLASETHGNRASTFGTKVDA
jgi:hypothetical protein